MKTSDSKFQSEKDIVYFAGIRFLASPATGKYGQFIRQLILQVA